MPEHEPVANERTIPGLSMAAFDPRNPTRASMLVIERRKTRTSGHYLSKLRP